MTPRRRKKNKGIASIVVLGAGVMALALGALVIYAESRLSQLVLGGLGESFSTKVYSAPFVLKEGPGPSPERLMARLGRLGYVQVQGAPSQAGTYSWQPPFLNVYLRGFKSPGLGQEAGLFALERSGERWAIRASSQTAAQLALEPELAAELSGPRKIRREPASAEEIPRLLKQAVVAAEDKRFYSHWGIDWRATLRALRSDLFGRGALQGGSTITQQLSKNIFLSPKRNLKRKLAEAALALYLELRYGKEKILALYLNHIYLGQEGATSVAGVKAAAKFYFGKELKDLALPDCALIAALIRSPHRYNPWREPAAARERRDFVLGRMREEGMIGETELTQARGLPLGTRTAPPPGRQGRDNDYFVAEAVRRLLPRYGEEALFRHGLSIYTTMDPLLQKAAQRVIKEAKPQGALVALDPRTGAVLALCGGRDFSQSQFNRATQARRQPGSAFKPFVYAAALDKGFTPATMLADQPKSYLSQSTSTWDPRNYEGIYFGTATLRQALAHSLNAATLDLANKTGVAAITDFARRLGIQSPLENTLATALGASEVTLLELTAAYAPFDNGGMRVGPELIAGVLDSEGSVLELARPDWTVVLTPAQGFLMTSLLQSVVAEGTAKSLSALGFTRPAAGKTGTTNDGRDAWFVGYTPAILAGVWVGDDSHRALRATGAKNALPLWAAFMKEAAQDFPAGDFEQPQGLALVSIDPASGLRARSGCPVKREELFVAGTEPAQYCPLHPGGLIGWFKRWFGR